MNEIFNNPPEWEFVKLEFERMKRENNLTNEKIADLMGYSSRLTFRSNRAYKRVVTGIVRIWLVTNKK